MFREEYENEMAVLWDIRREDIKQYQARPRRYICVGLKGMSNATDWIMVFEVRKPFGEMNDLIKKKMAEIVARREGEIAALMHIRHAP
jgi:hypothetical protein